MKSFLALLATLPISMSALIGNTHSNKDYFSISEEHVVTSVLESHINDSELRLYNEGETLIIDKHVFDACSSLNSLMLTFNVSEVKEQIWPNALTTINFTGSFEEYGALNISFSGIVNYYACDEGFIYNWDKNVRVTENTNLCDSVSKEQYLLLVEKYNALSSDEKEVVDAYKDKANSTIKDSMKYLKGIYGEQESRKSEKETSSSLMITLILTTAIIGMTFIAVLYLLKDKNIIN